MKLSIHLIEIYWMGCVPDTLVRERIGYGRYGHMVAVEIDRDWTLTATLVERCWFLLAVVGMMTSALAYLAIDFGRSKQGRVAIDFGFQSRLAVLIGAWYMSHFGDSEHHFQVPVGDYIIPSGVCYIAIENGPVEIVDFPMKNGWIFQFVM